ncbi:MAG: ankyrin repeat domain-containing protein [Pseudomonadota bacterium]
MNPKLKAYLEAEEERYPHSLESKFKRILDKIAELWGTPMLDEYFEDLLIDKRGDRQGFPADVMRDLFFLHGLHERLMRSRRTEPEDIWSNEEIKRGLEAEGIEYSPRGFFKAIELGNRRAFELFMQAGVDVDYRNDVGWTPLMVAVFMGSEASAQMVLEAGADVHARDNLGYGPMHWAAYQGFPGVIELLITKGANVNVMSDKGLTPLLQAAARGHGAAIKLLIARGAFINQPDKQGWIPLHKAVANGHLEAVQLLLAAGADRKARHQSGVTPVDIAVQKNRPEIIAAVG